MPARRALSERRRATGRLSCRVDSFRRRRAVIGNKLEKVRLRGFGCHQLPFQSGRARRCVVPDQVRQPCSNLNTMRRGETKKVKRRLDFSAAELFALLPPSPRRVTFSATRSNIYFPRSACCSQRHFNAFCNLNFGTALGRRWQLVPISVVIYRLTCPRCVTSVCEGKISCAERIKHPKNC